MPIYTYSDSESGLQAEEFAKLSALIEHIEKFPNPSNSAGIINQNGKGLIGYFSDDQGLTFYPID